jgi:hypothetical protein
MRGKDYNAGLRGVLFEARHYERMGSALWLYGWLVLRQTHQTGSVGWVLGGAPISYHVIEEETGFNPRTLERWMQTLRKHGYVETEAVPSGIRVRITKAKKFPQGGRNLADRLRKVAEGGPQNSVATRSQSSSGQNFTDGISSSSVGRSQEIQNRTAPFRKYENQYQNHKKQRYGLNPNRSGSGEGQRQRPKPQREARPAGPPMADPRGEREQIQEQLRFLAEARMRMQLLRAEREEAVRRELAVGTNPETERP